MIKSAKSALATYFGWELSEVKEYEYHPGQYTKPVYGLSDAYFCATKNKKKLPVPLDDNDYGFEWEEVKDDFVNSYGWYIFKAPNK